MKARAKILLPAVLFLAGMATAIPERPAGWAKQTNARRPDPAKKYLFLDDRWIEQTYQVVRTVPPPVKHPLNPILVADKPWEGTDVYTYGTVLIEDGKFRMWYQIFNPAGGVSEELRTAVAYAESNDGLHWTKPLMRHVLHDGQPTNLVLKNHGTSDLCSPAVIRDMKESDPAKRYKMLYWDSMSEKDLDKPGPNFPLGVTVPGWRAIPGEGFFTAHSPDGLAWTNSDAQPVFTCPCDASSMTQAADGTYRAYFKISVAKDRHFRILGMSESRDFITWTEPRVILEPDWRDAFGTEVYGMSVSEYAGNTIGLIWTYSNSPSNKRTNLQLATTDEKGAWQRAGDRRVFLANGPDGSWDAGQIYAASDLLVSPPGHPDEIWLYYGGSTVTHDDSRFRETSIGLATFRLDGFAAMEAPFFDGWLVSKPVAPEAQNMYINASARLGHIVVEALDEKGGVTATSKKVESTDSTRIKIIWAAGTPPRPGRQCVFRFLMKKASLYSFWFE